MSLRDAKMLPESPRCPPGCSNAILRTTKIICFGEFYLCKRLAIFHGIHVSRGRFLIKAGRQEHGQKAGGSESREVKRRAGFNGTASIRVLRDVTPSPCHRSCLHSRGCSSDGQPLFFLFVF